MQVAAPNSPRAALRPLLLRLALVAVAVAVGLYLQGLLGERLEAIQARSQVDMLAARAELAWYVRWVGAGVFGLTAACGAAITASSYRSPTRPHARILLALGAAVVVLSLLGLGLCWYGSAVISACRAQ